MRRCTLCGTWKKSGALLSEGFCEDRETCTKREEARRPLSRWLSKKAQESYERKMRAASEGA